MSDWLKHDWFTLVQSAGIIGTLLITLYTLRRDAWSRKITNYLSLISYHRDIWRITIEKPQLNRIKSFDQSLTERALTDEERQFLTFVFLHITCSYEMQKHHAMPSIQMLSYDIAELTRAPLVKRFWEENKRYYNDDVVQFIDSCK